MTFDPNVPNASQSPGLFPPQNNTNFARLKTIIAGDHVFNDTTQTSDGFHNQVHMFVRASPSTLDGANSILYSWVDANSQTQLRFYNGAFDYQITPIDTVLTGTVTINSSTFTNIVAVPANVFGDVYLWKGHALQVGGFVSDGSIVNGFAFSEKFQSGTGAQPILQLGFDGAGVNGLNLTVVNNQGSSFNGVWNFKVFFRSKV